MTVSGFAMRRIYFPVFLGFRSRFVATALCMLAIGIWHAPSFPWLFWAAHHTIAMSLEYRARDVISRKLSMFAFDFGLLGSLMARLMWVVGTILTWVVVSLGHSFTMFSDFDRALSIYLFAISSIFSPEVTLDFFHSFLHK